MKFRNSDNTPKARSEQILEWLEAPEAWKTKEISFPKHYVLSEFQEALNVHLANVHFDF